jgi:DNA polymerase III subunit chi
VTRIDFYRYARDKVHFACRLAARAYDARARVVVWSPEAAVLEAFDQALWAFQPTRFVPHVALESPLAAETPVVLARSGESLPHHEVLLNLGDGWPPFFASFDRVLEIVGADDADKERARARYAFYKQRGYELKVNDVEAQA